VGGDQDFCKLGLQSNTFCRTGPAVDRDVPKLGPFIDVLRRLDGPRRMRSAQLSPATPAQYGIDAHEARKSSRVDRLNHQWWSITCVWLFKFCSWLAEQVQVCLMKQPSPVATFSCIGEFRKIMATTTVHNSRIVGFIGIPNLRPPRQ
jgi:hypothetical protein